MNKLIMLCGIPASGKTYFSKMLCEENSYVTVSRDAIRFSLVNENKEYFSKEDEVFDKFVELINKHGAHGKTVVADATHITPQSRAKLLTRINWDCFDSLQVEVFVVSYQEALERNSKRVGREKVPEHIINNMYEKIKLPTFNELWYKCGGKNISLNLHR